MTSAPLMPQYGIRDAWSCRGFDSPCTHGGRKRTMVVSQLGRRTKCLQDGGEEMEAAFSENEGGDVCW